MINFIKNAAKNSIEQPNLAKAFVFFLLPFILSLVIAVLIGVSVNLLGFGYNIFVGLVSWFLSAVVLFVTVHLFKGKAASGKFRGILAGLGFRYVFAFLLMLLAFSIIFLVLPEFFPIVSKAQNAPTPTEAYNLIGGGLDSLNQSNGALLFLGFGVIILGTIIVILAVLYLVYQLIALSGEGSSRQNLLILLIWVIAETVLISLL